MMNQLRPVLQKIFENLKQSEPVWDLCCDHGQLGERALRSGVTSEVHFVDQSSPVMATLKSNKKDLVGATFYLLDAAHLPTAVSGSVAISGVGSHTAIKILDNLKWQNDIRLLISVNNKLELFKAYIESRRWQAFVTEYADVAEKNRLRPFFRIDLPADEKTRL